MTVVAKPSPLVTFSQVGPNTFKSNIYGFQLETYNANRHSAKECLYLETGALPIKLNYWHHIVTRDKSELINRVYLAQKRRPVKDDWVLTLNDDKEAVKINFTDEERSTMKKEQFKKI